MLKSIAAKNLKGLTFEQDLGPKTLIIGPNGSGKTARLIAINLLTLGYHPGIGKRPIDIMGELATAEKLQITGQFTKAHLVRRYSTTKAGAKQDYCISRKKASKDEFAVELSKQPKVIDLSTFTDLSDDKKIEYLIGLYGDSDELNKIDADIAEKREDINAKRLDLRSKEKTATDLADAQNAIDLPAGTLAEIRAEIETVTADYKTTRDNLETARAEQKAMEEQAEREMAEIARDADIEAAKGQEESLLNQEPDFSNLDEFGDPIPGDPGGAEETIPSNGDSWKCLDPGEKNTAAEIAKDDPMGGIVNDEAAASIQKIIDAMDRGCKSLCAAKMIAEMELKKYIGREAA